MKIGILLGSFDPIHIGHIYMAVSVLNKGLVDKVIFTPTVQNPWKEHKAVDFGDRCFMIQLAIDNIPGCVLSCADYRTPEPHYSSNVLEILKEEYPDDELYLIVGADLVSSIGYWHEGKWILDNFKLITIDREGYDDSADIKQTISISSTEIREMIKNHKQIYPFVPKVVINYIKENHLYDETKFFNN
jgi:nicotinate-nucleotide adenylyltransferase